MCQVGHDQNPKSFETILKKYLGITSPISFWGQGGSFFVFVTVSPSSSSFLKNVRKVENSVSVRILSIVFYSRYSTGSGGDLINLGIVNLNFKNVL